MTIIRKRDFLAVMFVGALFTTSALAQNPSYGEERTPGYNNKIPSQVMTPSTVSGDIEN